MSLINYYQEELDVLKKNNLYREKLVVNSPCGTEILIGNKKIVNFTSNDYLSLANSKFLKIKLAEGLRICGSGSGGSHLISGHYKIHQDLEKKLSTLFKKYFNKPKSLLFSTGYHANIGIMQAITSVKSKKISIFSEKYNHASIIDGIKLVKKNGLINLQIYKNSNLEELTDKLKKDTSDLKIIVTDGVFSMDESIAPLPQLLKISKKYNSFLIIDDAHGFGVLGNSGLGIMDYFNVKKIDTANLIYIATLGKSCGITGAFVMGHETLINFMIQKSRTYIYTTAIPPFICYALIKILEDPIFLKQKSKLQNLITYFDNQLNSSRQIEKKTSAIKIFMVRDNQKTLEIQKKALKKNILVSCIRPPTVPIGGARIRVSINANHKKKDINNLIQFLKNEI